MVGASKKKRNERDRGVPPSRPLQDIRAPSHIKWDHQTQLRRINVSHDLSLSPTVSHPAPNSTTLQVNHHRRRAISSIPVAKKSLVATTDKNVKAKYPISISTPIDGASTGDTTGIGAIREKLTRDLIISADRLKLQILEDKEKDSNNNRKASKEELQRVLRPRGPSGKALNEGGIGNVGLFPFGYMYERVLGSSLASDKGDGSSGSGAQQMPKLSIALSKEEIETDFLLMTGDIPPVKPKRRSKALQKRLESLDKLFPGSSLVEGRSWTYEVPDNLHEPKVEM